MSLFPTHSFSTNSFETHSFKTQSRVGTKAFAVGFLVLAAFAANAQNSGAVRSTTGAPQFQIEPSWPKPLPNRWLTAEVGGTCTDQKDHVFVVNRLNLTPDEVINSVAAPPVIEFDHAGNVANSWGDVAILPAGIHGCFVDFENNIWIAGNKDAIVQKYSHDGSKLLLQIGVKGKFDTTDGTISAAPLNTSQTMLNRPSDIAVDPASGDVFISDGYGNRRIVVFSREGKFLRQWGRQASGADIEAGTGGTFAGTVHCVVIGNDGLAYVCDRKGNRIQVFDKMGHYEKSIAVDPDNAAKNENGSAWWFAFSPDNAQKFMFVADGSSETILTIDRISGKPLARFGRPGHQPGDFTFLHTVAIDSHWNLYTGEVINGRRMQKFSMVKGPSEKAGKER